MWNLFITRLKCLFRTRGILFWTLLFPIVLSTFFNLAFSNIYSGEMFQSIPVGVINNQGYLDDTVFQMALKETNASDEEESKLFEVTECSREEAEELLSNGEIFGFIDVEDDYSFTVKDSAIEQTIVKSFLDIYKQHRNIITNIVKKDPSKLEDVMSELMNTSGFVVEKVKGENKPDTMITYYFALIAMASLYGCNWGLKEIIDIQADQSVRGARMNVAPIHKMKLLLCNLSAAVVVQICNILLLIAYLAFVLKIDFGNDIGYIILTCIVGSITGVTMGSMLSALIKKSEELQVSILVSITMICSFLAGLMIANMKYIVALYVPILQYINPAALIADAFYSLYYYDTYTRFFTNIGCLFGFSLLFGIITYLATRRREYASI